MVYRLLCSSRNLTFDRSWDTMFFLDGCWPSTGRMRLPAITRSRASSGTYPAFQSTVTDRLAAT